MHNNALNQASAIIGHELSSLLELARIDAASTLSLLRSQ